MTETRDSFIVITQDRLLSFPGPYSQSDWMKPLQRVCQSRIGAEMSAKAKACAIRRVAGCHSGTRRSAFYFKVGWRRFIRPPGLQFSGDHGKSILKNGTRFPKS